MGLCVQYSLILETEIPKSYSAHPTKQRLELVAHPRNDVGIHGTNRVPVMTPRENLKNANSIFLHFNTICENYELPGKGIFGTEKQYIVHNFCLLHLSIFLTFLACQTPWCMKCYLDCNTHNIKPRMQRRSQTQKTSVAFPLLALKVAEK